MPERPKVQAPEKREFHIVTSLEQYLAYQPKKMSDEHVMLYRGHERTSYKLLATLHRVPGIYKLGESLHDHFLKVLANFLEQGTKQGFIPANWKAMDDFNRSALAQHHGVPTPILDWTLDPKVALFFATTDIAGNEDAEVIAQHGKLISKPGEGYTIDGSMSYRDIPPQCDRHKAQNGVFTYSPLTEAGKFIPIDERHPGTRSFYEDFRFRIPHQYRETIQKELHDAGVNYATLFPDAEGLARHHAWLLRKRLLP